MPFWADTEWGDPQYHTTIQAGRRMFPKTRQKADVDGDGQDELIGRNATGIQVQGFDTATGQWQFRQSGPTLTDYSLLQNIAGENIGWEQPQYYRTIQTADINGDGKAELIARDNTGIKVWSFGEDSNNADAYPQVGKWTELAAGPAWHDYTLLHPLTTAWDQADRYLTIQCADIDGDGRDEILGRSCDPTSYQTGTRGMQVWKYNASGEWIQMPSATDFSDANGWNQPQYYETIQCADLDGDGKAELFGRAADGIHIYKYVADPSSPSDPTKGSWVQKAVLTEFSDSAGWAAPEYYSTIQCAVLETSHLPYIVGRGSNGIFGLRYEGYDTILPWFPLTALPDFADVHGWNQEEYYSTIQFADINGDGLDEIIARGTYGTVHYGYSYPHWYQISDGPAWSNDPKTSIGGIDWSQPQYYRTIQTAKVKTSVGTRSILIAKAAISMQSWIYNGGWDTATLKFPQYISDGVSGSDADQQAKAYQYLKENLTISAEYKSMDIRDRYGLLSEVDTWQHQLTYGNPDYLPLPTGMKQSNYDVVCNQLYRELDKVNSVQSYQSKMHTWYTGSFTQHQASFNKLDVLLKDTETVTPRAGTTWQTILSFAVTLLSSAVGIAGGYVEKDLTQTFSNISFLAAGAAGLPGLFPTGPKTQIDLSNPQAIAYANISDAITDCFDNILLSYDQNVMAITRDLGLLTINAVMDVTWDSTGMDSAMTAAQTPYEYRLLQAMVPYYWFNGVTWDLPSGYPQDADSPIAYYISGLEELGNMFYHWASTDSSNRHKFAAPTTLKKVFGDYGAPAYSVLAGGNGWTALPVAQFDNVPPIPGPVGAAVNLKVTPSLTRVPDTGEIEVSMLLENLGDLAAEDVQITSVQLGNRIPTTPPGATLQLRRKQAHGQAARFFPSPAAVGATVVLRIQGTYKGGTFGGSFRVKVP